MMKIFNIIRLYFRKIATIVFLSLVVLLSIISCAAPDTSFADSLWTLAPEEAVNSAMKYVKNQENALSSEFKKEIGDICNVLYSRGFYDAVLEIVSYPFGIDKDKNTELSKRLLTSVLLLGKSAPTIEGLNYNYGKSRFTLLCFHNSQSSRSLEMVDFLINNYPALQESGIKVVSISSDQDIEIFENYSRFWKRNRRTKFHPLRYSFAPDIIYHRQERNRNRLVLVVK